MSAERFRQLPEAECRALLGAAEIGRVGVSVAALPAIIPVRFAVVDDDVVFRTARETLLADVVANAIVAFEADAIDRRRGHGWSVLVVGLAQPINDHEELERVRNVPLAPWCSSDDSFVRISTDRISGRMLEPSEITGPDG